jgi:hypothetical protein
MFTWLVERVRVPGFAGRGLAGRHDWPSSVDNGISGLLPVMEVDSKEALQI